MMHANGFNFPKNRFFARKAAVLMLAAMLVCQILPGCSEQEERAPVDMGNPAFNAILKKQKLLYYPSESDSYEVATFAEEPDVGCIVVLEIKHNGDKVCEITKREYYDPSLKTEEEMEGLKQNISYFVDSLNKLTHFYSVAEMRGDSYCYTVIISNMDNPKYFEEIRRQGVLSVAEEGKDYLSYQHLRDIILMGDVVER